MVIIEKYHLKEPTSKIQLTNFTGKIKLSSLKIRPQMLYQDLLACWILKQKTMQILNGKNYQVTGSYSG